MRLLCAYVDVGFYTDVVQRYNMTSQSFPYAAEAIILDMILTCTVLFETEEQLDGALACFNASINDATNDDNEGSTTEDDDIESPSILGDDVVIGHGGACNQLPIIIEEEDEQENVTEDSFIVPER